METKAAERILKKLEIENKRCRPITLLTGLTSGQLYKEVVTSTVDARVIGDPLNIPKQTLFDNIEKLYRKKKILLYRFYGPDMTYISNDDFELRRNEFPRPPSIRIALPMLLKEEFVGQSLLRQSGGSIVMGTGVSDHISVSTSDSMTSTNDFRVHFMAGTQLMHLCIRSSIFDFSNAKPVTLFLSTSNFLDTSMFKRPVLKEHLDSFGIGSMMLSIPDSSFGTAGPFVIQPWADNPFQMELFNLGLYILTFFPNGRSIVITAVKGIWPPLAASLSEDETSQLLNTEVWKTADGFWPEAIEYFGQVNPPTPKTLTIESRCPKLLVPPIFSLNTWVNFTKLFLEEYAEAELDLDSTSQYPEIFSEYMEDFSWKLQSPCLIKLRKCHLLITS